MTNDKIDMDKTFKQGVGGGILGAFVGAPGLGMGLGMLHANKDKLKAWGRRMDGTGPHGRMMGPGNYKECPYREKKSAKDDPAAYFY